MQDDPLLPKIKRLYTKNRRTHRQYSYTIPSEDTYPYQWLWDSCFHAITLSYFDTDQAKEELRALVSAQYKNGMLPHIIYWKRIKNHPFPEIPWGKRRTSSITQPPLVAVAVQKVYTATGDIEFVREMLPHIHHFHRYLIRHRDPRKSGLIGVINPDESGEDNSPRFDEALELHDPMHPFVDNFSSRLKLVDDWRNHRYVVKNRMDEHHWVRDVPINAILAESLAVTAELARICNDAHIEEWSRQHAEIVKEAMKEHLRDSGGLYWSTMDYGSKERPIHVRTWALFMPLYAGVASPAEAKKLVDEYLLDKREFGTRFGVPTVSLSEPSFDPNGDWQGDWWIGTNWRGPVWMASNWLIVQGLKRYGFMQEADAIIQQSRKLVQQSGFREYYDPLTGEGHGARGFTWGGLLLDMPLQDES